MIRLDPRTGPGLYATAYLATDLGPQEVGEGLAGVGVGTRSPGRLALPGGSGGTLRYPTTR